MQEGQAPAWQAQGSPTDTHQQIIRIRLLGQATTVEADRQDRAQQQYGNRNRRQHRLRHVQCDRRGGQVAQCGQGGQRRQGTAQGQTGKQGHAGDFCRPQAVARVQAIAHRAARQQRQADGIADRECGEAPQKQGAGWQGHAGITRRRPFIAEQHHEADNRCAQCTEQRWLRDLQNRIVQGVEVEFA
ncbi:hypothetical protein D3C78_1266210 [compost metagenome]